MVGVKKGGKGEKRRGEEKGEGKDKKIGIIKLELKK